MLTDTHVVTAMLLNTVKLTADFFARTPEHIGISVLTGKQLEKDREGSDYFLQHIGHDRFDILATNVNKVCL